MKSKIELEIYFPSEEEVSINMKSENKQDKEGELLLFSRYSLQQMANFGGNETSAQIASFLLDVSKDFKSFLADKDPDAPSLVAGKISKKKFSILSTVDDETFDFNLVPSGFGLFGKGLGYYGPTSIFSLLKYLSSKREDDVEYQKALAKISGLSGKAFFDKKITFENRATLPMEILNKSLK